MELLDPCYAAITGHYLDGSRFEKWGEGSRRPRTHIKAWESKAVFHGFLDSVDGAVSFTMDKQKRQGAYTCHKGMSIGGRRIVNRIGIIQTQKVWSVPHEELDHIILDRLCNLAQHDSDLADRVKAFWVSRKTSEMDEAQVLKTQIEKTQAQIKHLDRLLTNPASPLTEEAEKRYIKMLKEAEVDLQRLLKKQAEQNEHEDPETVIPNFYYVLLHLPIAYKTLTNESQKKMIRKVIKQVKLNIVSPHLFLLCIEWENGIAVRPDIALVWRGVTPNNADEWSEEEDNIMRMYYPDSPQIELMQALPHRAWYRICDRAQVLNLRRNIPNQGRTRVNMYHRTMRYDDLEAIARLVQGEEEKERVRQIANKLAQQTMRGGLSAHWWLPLNSVSYACLDIEAVSEANNIELLHLSGFPYGVPHPSGSLRH